MSGITPPPSVSGPTNLGVTADGRQQTLAQAEHGRPPPRGTGGPTPVSPTPPAVTLTRAAGPPLAAAFEPAGMPGRQLQLGLRLMPPAMAGSSGPPSLPATANSPGMPASPALPATPGLPAMVVGPAGNGGLLLDLMGHRLTLQVEARSLPPGTLLTVQLLPPGGAAPVQDPAGLDQLLTNLVRQAAGSGEAGRAGSQSPAAAQQPLPADASLAARLVADWQRLAGRGGGQRPGETSAAAAAGTATSRSGGLSVEVEAGRVLVNDRDTGWRGLFGLLGNPGEIAAPLAAWRRDAEAGRSEEEERLLLTLDLSRLGRTVIDLRITDRLLRARIVSGTGLPEPIRAELAAGFAAAAEIAGREASLIFGLARPPPVGEGGRRDDWA